MMTVQKSDFSDLERLYTVTEIAKILHLHPETVRRFIKSGRMEALKHGREWIITHSMLMNYYRENFKPNTNRAI